MITSEKGRGFIEGWEKRRSVVYLDSAGYPTVGIGHKVLPADSLKVGDCIDDARIDALFAADLAPIDEVLNHFSLEQHEHDACASLAFNIGVREFGASTLAIFLCRGKKQAAADEFRRWVFARKKRIAGLADRRESERDLFLTGIYDSTH